MSGMDSPLRPGAWRRRLVLAAWMCAGAITCLRAGQVQVLHGADWDALAADQYMTDKEVVAARGPILDRDGALLTVSREKYRVAVASNELTDADSAAAVLRKTLDLTPKKAKQMVSGDRRWAVVPGSFPPTVREALAGVRGVYLERELERYHPHGDLARGALGMVLDGAGQGGIEQTYDELLRGRPGGEVVARDNVGRPIPGETFMVQPPKSGGQVVLTLDLDLQEIARQALEQAIETSEARGGDVLITEEYLAGSEVSLLVLCDGADAVAGYERVRVGGYTNWGLNTAERLHAMMRLGPLYEALGDTTKAIEAYRRMVDQWADSDERGQETVTRFRERMVALGG